MHCTHFLIFNFHYFCIIFVFSAQFQVLPSLLTIDHEKLGENCSYLLDAKELPTRARMLPHEEETIRWILGENGSLVDEEPCVKIPKARNYCRA